jgi:IS605 OrfB family transposase
LEVLFKKENEYKGLHCRQLAQQTLRDINGTWKSFQALMREYKNPTKRYDGKSKKIIEKPSKPRYKDKIKGQCVAIFTDQVVRIKDGIEEDSNVIWNCGIKEPRQTDKKILYIHFPKEVGLSPIKTRLKKLKQVRIVPKGFNYIIEIVYERKVLNFDLIEERIAGIDIGINILMAIANNVGLEHFLIDGKPVKVINQFFEKEMARLRRERDLQLKKERTEFQAICELLRCKFDKKSGLLSSKSFTQRKNKVLRRKVKHEAYFSSLSDFINGESFKLEGEDSIEKMVEYLVNLYSNKNKWTLSEIVKIIHDFYMDDEYNPKKVRKFLMEIVKDEDFSIENFSKNYKKFFKVKDQPIKILKRVVKKLFRKEKIAIEKLKKTLEYYDKYALKPKTELIKMKLELKDVIYAPTKRMENLKKTRATKLKNYFHQASRYIINWCIENRIGTLVIGYNECWKQKTKMGKRMNQIFAGIPFLKLINAIRYKAEEVGISVILVNEAHTSKCSFLDCEPIKHHDNYIGERTRRGTFKSGNGHQIHADINSALNIIKRARPDSFNEYIEMVSGQPRIKKTKLENLLLNPRFIKLKNNSLVEHCSKKAISFA